MAAAEDSFLDGMRTFIQEKMQVWKVPGVAVVIVRNGEVVLQEGFGFRDVERGLPATPNTLFAIGSSTKAFTAAVVAALVDEGKLEWDRPVRDYLPGFRLHDPFASERITLRDMLCHRSGLPRHDLFWYSSTLTREEIIARLRYLPASRDFRTVWQYQNLMFMTAGYIAGHVAGGTWEDAVHNRLFGPLGMASSNFSVTESQRTGDFALPYLKKNGASSDRGGGGGSGGRSGSGGGSGGSGGDGNAKVIPIPFRNIDTVGPAGSINSCARDMAKWLQLHINEGRLGGREIISAAALREMHSPQMVIQQPVQYAELPLSTYGMGWFIGPYRGAIEVQHGGNIDGFSALVSFLPAHKTGVVVLTNLGGNPLSAIISRYVYDQVLGLEPVDWSGRLLEAAAKVEEGIKEKKRAEAAAKRKASGARSMERSTAGSTGRGRARVAKPTHPLADYVGDYEHPGYGTVTVAWSDETEKDALELRYNALTCPLTHKHYDVFEARYDLFDMVLVVNFQIGLKGEIASLSVPLEAALEPQPFTKVPPKPSAALEERLMGRYMLNGTIPVDIARRGAVLSLVIPGQPAFDLTLRGGTTATFDVKGFPLSLAFTFDEAGRPTGFALTQPNAVFQATRASTAST